MRQRQHIWQCRGAWILMIIAIVFWLWFGIGSAIVEDDGWFNWLMHILIPGGIFILSAGIAWRWERIGGVVLIVEGIIAIGFLGAALTGGRSNPDALFLMLLTLALPPLLAGVLLLVCTKRGKSARDPRQEHL